MKRLITNYRLAIALTALFVTSSTSFARVAPVSQRRMLHQGVKTLTVQDKRYQGKPYQSKVITLKAQTKYDLYLQTKGFAPRIYIFSSQGAFVAMSKPMGNTGNVAGITFTPKATDNFHVVATTMNANRVGLYRLTVMEYARTIIQRGGQPRGTQTRGKQPRGTQTRGGRPTHGNTGVTQGKNRPRKDNTSQGTQSNVSAADLDPVVKQTMFNLYELANKNGNSIRLSDLLKVSFRQHQNLVNKAVNLLDLDHAKLHNVQFGEDGVLSGDMSFKNHTVNVLFQAFAPNGNGLPQWALTIRLPKTANTIIPPKTFNLLKGELIIHGPVVLISTLSEEMEIESSKMSKVTYGFYKRIYDENVFTATVKTGIRFESVSTFKPQARILRVLKRLEKMGFKYDRKFTIEGQLVEKLTPDAGFLTQTALSKGKSLLSGMQLKFTLPELKAPLPFGKELGIETYTSQPYVLATADPSIKLAWTWKFIPKRDPKNYRTLEVSTTIGAEIAKDPSASIRFTGSTTGWKNAFGIQGFDLEKLVLDSSIDSSYNFTFGWNGRVRFRLKEFSNPNGRVFDIARDAGINLSTLMPTQHAIRIGTAEDGLGIKRDELIAMVNTLTKMFGKGRNFNVDRIRSYVPDFELKDYYFSFAPLGGNEALGIDDGIALKGELIFMGETLGKVDGKVNWTDDPELKLFAFMKDMNLKGLSFRNVKSDILISSKKIADSRVKLSGELQLSGSFKKSVNIHVDKSRMHFEFTDRMNGFSNATFKLTNYRAKRKVYIGKKKVKKRLPFGKSISVWERQYRTEYKNAWTDWNLRASIDVTGMNKVTQSVVNKVNSKLKLKVSAPFMVNSATFTARYTPTKIRGNLSVGYTFNGKHSTYNKTMNLDEVSPSRLAELLKEKAMPKALAIIDDLGGVYNDVKGKVENGVNDVKGRVEDGANTVGGVVEDGISGIGGAVTNPGGTLGKIGGGVKKGLGGLLP